MEIRSFHSHTHSSLLTQSAATGLQEQARISREATTQDQTQLAKLRERDRQVRAHEQAHIAASGGLAKGGATFSFQRGPDGKQYAVGGEVHIDTSPVSGDPEATIRKAKQIRAAALAPADPSAQDRAVAASASALEAKARRELQQEDDTPATQHETTASSSFPRIDLFV